MTSQSSTKAARGTAWAVGAFYLLIAFEFFYMASPFAMYFYGAYLPGLEYLNRVPALSWLTSFFLPHYVATSSSLVGSATAVGQVMATVGMLGFLIGAGQVYSRKLRRRGAATEGVYRLVRHPQYASLVLAGAGMLLVWPRFLMVVFFVTMLFAYHALAWIEERECLRRYGQAYATYQQRTPRFLPFPLPFARRGSSQPWPVRLAAGALAYSAALALALGAGFALQAYSIRHLFAYETDDAVYLALTPLDGVTLRRVAQIAATDLRIRARLAPSTDQGVRLINYVMPWEWAMTEIPMRGERDHHTPDDYDRRKFKIVFTKPVLRTRANGQGLYILRSAARTEPVGEAWIDEEGRVARVLEPPGEVYYGTVPVPVF